MKKISIIFLMLLFFGNIKAQSNINESEIKTALNRLFEISKNKNYDAAALLMVYNGNNSARRLKDSFNSKNDSELKEVKRNCKKINAYLDLSDSFEYDQFIFNTYEGLPTSTVIINFLSGNQILKISFTFIKVNNKILLLNLK